MLRARDAVFSGPATNARGDSDRQQDKILHLSESDKETLPITNPGLFSPNAANKLSKSVQLVRQ